MKSKSIKKERNEFRRNKDEFNHPHFVFEQNGHTVKSIGITHDTRTYDMDNEPLHKNPNPKETRKAYARPVVTKSRLSRYRSAEKDWAFDKEDLPLIEKIKKRDKPSSLRTERRKASNYGTSQRSIKNIPKKPPKVKQKTKKIIKRAKNKSRVVKLKQAERRKL